MYRLKRLPFGRSCSASIFVRQLQGALAPVLKHGWVKSYLDDVIVCVPNFDCLLQRLGQVFEHMEEVGIKSNHSKFHIGQQEVKFFGYVVSKRGIKPNPENVEVVSKMKLPTHVKETRRFLGMAGFYRKHRKVIGPCCSSYGPHEKEPTVRMGRDLPARVRGDKT